MAARTRAPRRQRRRRGRLARAAGRGAGPARRPRSSRCHPRASRWLAASRRRSAAARRSRDAPGSCRPSRSPADVPAAAALAGRCHSRVDVAAARAARLRDRAAPAAHPPPAVTRSGSDDFEGDRLQARACRRSAAPRPAPRGVGVAHEPAQRRVGAGQQQLQIDELRQGEVPRRHSGGVAASARRPFGLRSADWTSAPP